MASGKGAVARSRNGRWRLHRNGAAGTQRGRQGLGRPGQGPDEPFEIAGRRLAEVLGMPFLVPTIAMTPQAVRSHQFREGGLDGRTRPELVAEGVGLGLGPARSDQGMMLAQM